MEPDLLTNLGLTKNEAIIYLTLLKLGESKVSKIIKEANFKSGKIYQILDSLTNKGIISYSIKNNIKYFYPQNPKKILEYIKLKKQRLEKEETDFFTSLPQLNQFYHEKKDSCDVKVYEGIEGIRSALFTLLDKLKRNSQILIFGANDDPNRDIILLWKKYDEICKKKNIKTKVIMSSLSKEGRIIRKKKRNKYKTYRYLAGKDISNFAIGGNIILIFNFNQSNCIFIENSEHVEQFTELFNILWKNSEVL